MKGSQKGRKMRWEEKQKKEEKEEQDEEEFGCGRRKKKVGEGDKSSPAL